MRPSLAIKTLFRTPGKTLFTFLLIAVLIFSLFIQLAEYFKTAAEFEETVDLYQGTGFVEYKPAVYKSANLRNPLYLKTDPRVDASDPSDASVFRYWPLSAEAVEEISSLPYVTVYKRYMTAGVSDRHMRMPENEACYDYNERIIVEGTLYTPPSVKITIDPLPTPKSPDSARFVLRYVWRHIRRQGLKSVLAVLLAALMVGAVVQFTSLRATYNQLRRTMEIPVQFTNSMSLPRLQPLVDEGFTKDVYYERTANIFCLAGTEDKKIQLVITSDIDRFLNQKYEIILGDGYTEEDISKLDHVLVSAVYMELQGLRPGDYIRFGTSFMFDSIFSAYKQKFLDEEFYSKGLEPSAIGDFPERQELYARYKEDIERDLDQKTDKAEIVGSIRTKRGGYISAVFTAGLDNPDSLVGTYQSMPLIEFTLSDNSRMEEMRQRAEEITHGREGAFVMDTEALEGVIQTSDLLNGLYLPVIVLALLIGAAMCVLLVMQTTKDAAIMRALGTTKRKTRSMLAVEQILLGVIGVILGLGIMLAIKGGAFAAIALQAGLFAAAYALVLVLGAYASAALATKKNILELLQTKE